MVLKNRDVCFTAGHRPCELWKRCRTNLMQWKAPGDGETGSEYKPIIFCLQGNAKKTGVSKTFIAGKGNTGS